MPSRVPTATLRRLAASTLAATILLVAAGGYTRTGDPDRGCGDQWPLCAGGPLGGLLPSGNADAFVAWSHRWLAAVVGILAIATAARAWRDRRSRRVLAPAVAAVGVIGFQGWLGRLIVAEDITTDLVSAHLAISMTAVALVTVTLVNTAVEPAPAGPAPASRSWALLLAVAAGGTGLVVLLGSYVHDLYFPGWPLVDDRLLPRFTNRYVMVHFAHRVAAFLVLVLLVRLVAVARLTDRPQVEYRLVGGATLAFLANVGLGAGQVFTEVGSSSLTAVHLLIAFLVWTQLVAGLTVNLAQT